MPTNEAFQGSRIFASFHSLRSNARLMQPHEPLLHHAMNTKENANADFFLLAWDPITFNDPKPIRHIISITPILIPCLPNGRNAKTMLVYII